MGPEMITSSPLLKLGIAFTPFPCEFLNSKPSCFGKSKHLLHLANEQITLIGIKKRLDEEAIGSNVQCKRDSATGAFALPVRKVALPYIP